MCTDLKIHLATTAYGNFLQNEASPLAVSTIDDKLKERLVHEFNHIRSQCVEPLATFLDFITYACCACSCLLTQTGIHT
jgi:V-type H+-transporting ATPase subunit d